VITVLQELHSGHEQRPWIAPASLYSPHRDLGVQTVGRHGAQIDVLRRHSGGIGAARPLELLMKGCRIPVPDIGKQEAIR